MSSNRPARVLAAVLSLALAAVACDGIGVKATQNNFRGAYSLFAVTGAPVNTATALSFLAGSSVADASFGFDVAFDIDSAGTTRLYPVRTLAGRIAGTFKRIGTQLVPGSFESLREAPASGYDTLTAPAVTTGSVVAVELQETVNCLYSANGLNMYAKLVVDSIHRDTRRIWVRTVTDPNCGFRQLMPDSIPSR